jgi:AcrR family transcriptional regulator
MSSLNVSIGGAMSGVETARKRAKANRRAALLDAAATQFADRGFARVSLEDIGAAVGVSGPAVYRHFANKQAVLAAMLIDVSRDLVGGGNAVIRHAPDHDSALRGLIAFHVEFALSNADVIVVQDRDLDSLTAADRLAVRTLQRSYIDAWVGVLGGIHPSTPVSELRIRVRATFGLINSTPHSARSSPKSAVRSLLETMALAALTTV